MMIQTTNHKAQGPVTPEELQCELLALIERTIPVRSTPPSDPLRLTCNAIVEVTGTLFGVIQDMKNSSGIGGIDGMRTWSNPTPRAFQLGQMLPLIDHEPKSIYVDQMRTAASNVAKAIMGLHAGAANGTQVLECVTGQYAKWIAAAESFVKSRTEELNSLSSRDATRSNSGNGCKSSTV